MSRFRSRPIEIEAMQYVYPNMDAVAEFAAPSPVSINARVEGGRALVVQSAQGPVTARPNDWIIREPIGSGVYPCNPAVFAAKYEPIDAPTG